MNELLTTAQAALRLGLSRRQVQTLIQKGVLPAERFGDVYQVTAADCDALPPRKVGWPAGRKRTAKAE